MGATEYMKREHAGASLKGPQVHHADNDLDARGHGAESAAYEARTQRSCNIL